MPKIMKLSDVGSSDAEVEQYLSSPHWVLQQKFDGTRIQAQWNPATQEIRFSNNGIDGVTHAAAKLKLPALELELRPMLEAWIIPVTIEGELLIRTGEFVVWDMLEGDDPDKWGTTRERLEKLTELLSYTAGPHHEWRLVKLSPTARTEEEKRRLWAEINLANVEGAVSKHLDSEYQPGIRSAMWVKHKLVKTADLVVLSVTREFKPNSTVVHKGSASLGYVDSRFPYAGPQPIASASLIGKDLTIAEGDVVEVAFLYREPGGGLVQPRITCKRWDFATETGDKKPGECTEDQFPVYSRQVV